MMNAIRTLNRRLDKALQMLLAVMFAYMIFVVFLQVFSRNVLEVSFIGILDIAQLLFSWSIFLGAAVALRWDTHYNLDLIPAHWHKTSLQISGLWLFLPIPLGGIAMGLFLIEMIPDEIRQLRAESDARKAASS